MQFLKGLFWFLIAVVVAVFISGNWKSVDINLWSGLIAVVNLPLLLLVFFLLGFLPMLLWHQATRWRMRQRLTAAERSIADLSQSPYQGIAATPVVVPTPEPLLPPPASVPGAVPPGGA